MTVIDPVRHADLIALQRAVFAATDALYTYEGDNAESMRELCRDAAEEKEAALYASGLVDKHGYHAANMALKNAARNGAS